MAAAFNLKVPHAMRICNIYAARIALTFSRMTYRSHF
jgi:hypothetical protein